ncbi:hypothetical protein CBM2586_B130489 [Cupriavidus phytorum]|uniref:Uncharacterized protein n=1 Tax=Cupriavidus taiwanensis TaxID=164546 RepID=A0A375CJ36_9BURK|nr:hypothetical protein CBM2586_B130489 [Cupriavidus taiwanensis]
MRLRVIARCTFANWITTATAIPALLLTELPPLPESALDTAEKLYQASLPKPSRTADEEQSTYERIL